VLNNLTNPAISVILIGKNMKTNVVYFSGTVLEWIDFLGYYIKEQKEDKIIIAKKQGDILEENSELITIITT